MNANKKQIWKISALASAISSAMLVSNVQAQEAAQEDEAKDVERVVITGSRIARDANLAAPSPVQSISAEDIQKSGEFSVTDIVNDIPSLFSSVNGESSKDNGDDFADGANVLNLRGLGSARTLVLVNGKRHVAGVEGTGAVDVGSIPAHLIKSVEVLTGGASAVYGADAVTGVVNFILNDEFEGFELDAQTGLSSEGDAQQTQVTATYGFNYDDDKGNFVVSLGYADDEGLRAGERDGGIFIGSATAADTNPAFRFQQGDIGSDTPAFSQFYSPANGFATFGARIPTDANAFIDEYESVFGTRPTLSSAELALIDQTNSAFPRAIVPGYTFGLTSGYGMIGPGEGFNFTGWDLNTPIDLDGNGVNDCLDSATGAFSSGVIGGCWFVTPEGNYRPIRDGIILDNVNSGGGDSFNAIQQSDGYVLLPEEKISLNMLTSYEINDDLIFKGEFKYASQKVEDVTQPTSFWDLLLGAPDNPYLPEFIQPLAQTLDGVSITIDPLLIGDGRRSTERDTMRGVLALEGFLENGWAWEASFVWGKFERETEVEDNVIVDRFFAAIDAVTDPATGQATCRSNLDPSAMYATTPFGLPAFDPGFFTFTPGTGSCVPLNIWAGANGPSQEALNWVTVNSLDSIELEQRVLSASLAGDLEDYFELPGGAIAFAIGAEYREEESTSVFDPWQRGVLPEGSPYGAGTLISEVSDNNSNIFDPAIPIRNESGEYDVWEIFFEAQLPILEGVAGFEELTLDLAGRYSDYSTIGTTTTWRANVMWAPVEDLRIRTSISQAVRAPNITELFGPTTGTTVSRNVDVCGVDSVSGNANRERNCAADLQAIGVNPYDANGNYNWVNPLTARFSGVTSGNDQLEEETADTLTVGFVYTPEWFEGFDLAIDYWKIELEDAINEVSENNILRACYDGAELNNIFCDLFTRNSDSSSQQFGGLNFLTNQPINFAKRETSGYDFSAAYKFDVQDHEFTVKVAGTKVDKLNDFTNPTDLTVVDEELHEVNRPEWAGNIFVDWTVGELTLSWQSQYMGEQGVTGVEIDDVFGYGCESNPDVECQFSSSVIQDEFWQHDLSFSYQVDDNLTAYGGIKNITDEEPFLTEFAFPASPKVVMYSLV